MSTITLASVSRPSLVASVTATATATTSTNPAASSSAGHVATEHHLEQLDVAAELRADGDQPFPIDRRAVKDVVQEKLGVRVDRVSFLSAGTFHKASRTTQHTRVCVCVCVYGTCIDG